MRRKLLSHGSTEGDGEGRREKNIGKINTNDSNGGTPREVAPGSSYYYQIDSISCGLRSFKNNTVVAESKMLTFSC